MKLERKLAIIGGGPVGLGLSLFLAREGYQVTVFEKGSYPRDKACGQGILPKGQRLLNEILDIDLGEYGYYFEGIEYIDKDLFLAGQFKNKAIGLERKVLSQLLYEEVESNKNIDLKVNHSISESEFLNLKNNYDYIFACDGINSPIRKWLKQDKARRGDLRQGARVHFNQAPWSSHVQVYWADGIEAYVTPVGLNRVEVAFLWYQGTLESKEGMLIDRLFSFFPDLLKKVNLRQMDHDFKGSALFSHTSKTSKFENIFFVGDSFGFLDGITGEGVSLGLMQAKYVAKNFNSWGFKERVVYRLMQFHYFILVHSALLLSRNLRLRAMLLRFLPNRFFTKILNMALE